MRRLFGCTVVAAVIAGLAVGQDKAAPKTKGKEPVPGYDLLTIEGFKVLINKKALA